VISLSLFDLDLLDDLIGDNLAGIAMMFGAQALLLAIMIAVALRNRWSRSPVERAVRKRFGGV
jgi:hypothetical protein